MESSAPTENFVNQGYQGNQNQNTNTNFNQNQGQQMTTNTNTTTTPYYNNDGYNLSTPSTYGTGNLYPGTSSNPTVNYPTNTNTANYQTNTPYPSATYTYTPSSMNTPTYTTATVTTGQAVRTVEVARGRYITLPDTYHGLPGCRKCHGSGIKRNRNKLCKRCLRSLMRDGSVSVESLGLQSGGACIACAGTGTKPNRRFRKCKVCDGSGKLY
mmetsp:Transcript_21027/g.23785  ORF Transcript_21027/g.23785 Transcript_21027/m.23785 type:complete len:213 (-) Transcript_21027:157-795(-)|eukprot:CAMPEP_0115038836 /NCGR_PEP_ID=MMETSP0216-20121206/43650_1 /TAXON_ID=223996 /ORGANISM="Protocruzia adherens, Strain Boccale" /LENGTH=212 /DNA_ID=CAMNT_0002419321 /DNA_START=49 /DNA_END=687 /DNA_ORIENTATION=+